MSSRGSPIRAREVIGDETEEERGEEAGGGVDCLSNVTIRSADDGHDRYPIYIRHGRRIKRVPERINNCHVMPLRARTSRYASFFLFLNDAT